MNRKHVLLAAFALALAACSAKPPATNAARPMAATNTLPAAPVVANTADPTDAEIARSKLAYAEAKAAAADFLIAHPGAADADVVAVATAAARQAGASEAADTGTGVLDDAKDWVAMRKSNGLPARSSPADLAANDAAADAAARKALAAMSVADRAAAADSEPEDPSSGPHYFPKIGTCFDTTVASVGTRLEGSPGSGDDVSYADGHHMTSYDTSRTVRAFRAGDPIHLCVTDLPGHCPPADDRGVGFVATDGRTGGEWKADDSEHACGGA